LLKKPAFKIENCLIEYLKKYARAIPFPITYNFLLGFSQGFAVYDSKGKDTLWETVIYEPSLQDEINEGLTLIYSMLKSDGEMFGLEHLTVDKIDFCTFGNSKPFRIKIINKVNDNYDYFYVKQADASRIFGLELEDLLSPNRVNFLVHKNTLIEEHIVGIPGDQFIENNLKESGHNEVRLAKEFIKFNERCYRRLLGDMRAYNFIVDITPDFDQIQYRLRAIDFDQQSYEGRRSFYLPHYFKENLPYVEMGINHVSHESLVQYQNEERALMAKRIHNDFPKLKSLLDCMKKHSLSTKEKLEFLKAELYKKEHIETIPKAQSMGELVEILLMDLVDK